MFESKNKLLNNKCKIRNCVMKHRLAPAIYPHLSFSGSFFADDRTRAIIICKVLLCEWYISSYTTCNVFTFPDIDFTSYCWKNKSILPYIRRRIYVLYKSSGICSSTTMYTMHSSNHLRIIFKRINHCEARPRNVEIGNATWNSKTTTLCIF